MLVDDSEKQARFAVTDLRLDRLNNSRAAGEFEAVSWLDTVEDDVASRDHGVSVAQLVEILDAGTSALGQ